MFSSHWKKKQQKCSKDKNGASRCCLWLQKAPRGMGFHKAWLPCGNDDGVNDSTVWRPHQGPPKGLNLCVRLLLNGARGATICLPTCFSPSNLTPTYHIVGISTCGLPPTCTYIQISVDVPDKIYQLTWCVFPFIPVTFFLERQSLGAQGDC